MKRAIFIGVFFVLFSQTSFSQWRKLWDFNDRVDVIYFQSDFGNSSVGFIGLANVDYQYKGNGQKIGAEIWKTQDGGKSWKRTAVVPFESITDIRFKDALVGWASVEQASTQVIFNGGCYKTIDGGESWFPVLQDVTDYSALHYNQSSKKLFISAWGGGFGSMSSDDDGITWKEFLPQKLLGYSFLDDKVGFVSSYSPSSYHRTFDGGLTWQSIPMTIEAYQPLAIKGTSSFIAICEVTYEVMRSDDLGTSWYQVYQFPNFQNNNNISGQIETYKNSLIINKTPEGFLLSNNGGSLWERMCGPYIRFDSRFCVSDERIYSADYRHMNNTLGSGLWVNHTGRGTGLRLGFVDNSKSVKVGEITSIDVSYPNESNYENVDSICFTMNLKGESMGFESDSVADGWRVKWREISDSTIHYCLERTTTDTIAFNSFILRLYMKAYLTRDTTAQLTLDEVNFNQDVTFRDCMIPTLKATDTVNFVVQDECGDSTLRSFLNSKPILEILSISPNPTSGDVTIDFSSLVEGNIRLQVINDFGNTVLEINKKINRGINEHTIPIPSFWNGTFFVRLQMGKDVVTGKFVKQ